MGEGGGPVGLQPISQHSLDTHTHTHCPHRLEEFTHITPLPKKPRPTFHTGRHHTHSHMDMATTQRLGLIAMHVDMYV